MAIRGASLVLALLACATVSGGHGDHAGAGSNQPPILSPIPSGGIYNDHLLVLNIRASDPDGDPLTFTAAPLPTGSYFVPRGDASLDGQLSSTDALLALQYSAALLALSAEGRAAADVNYDYYVEPNYRVDVLDAALILQGIAGLLAPANVWLFVWIPTRDQVFYPGPSYTVDFTVSDGQASDTETAKIMVNPYATASVAR